MQIKLQKRVLYTIPICLYVIWLALVVNYCSLLEGAESTALRMYYSWAREIPLYQAFGTNDLFHIDYLPPFFVILSGLLVRYVGNPIFVLRTTNVCICLALFWLFYLRSDRTSKENKRPLLLLAFATCFPLMRWCCTIRPDIFALFFCGLSFFILMDGLQNRNKHLFILSGALLAIAPASKHSFLGVASGLFAGFILSPKDRKLLLYSIVSFSISVVVLFSIFKYFYPLLFAQIFQGSYGTFNPIHALRISAIAIGTGLPLVSLSYTQGFFNLKDMASRTPKVILISCLLVGIAGSFKGGSDTNYFLEFYVMMMLLFATQPKLLFSSTKIIYSTVILFTASFVILGNELREQIPRRQSDAVVAKLLKNITKNDFQFFNHQGCLVEIPLNVGIDYTPYRMDHYAGNLHKAGIMNLAPLFRDLCEKKPAIVISLYDLSKRENRKDYLIDQLLDNVHRCTPYGYRCGEYFVYTDQSIQSRLPAECRER